jgi:hypothetical protein
MKRSLDSKLQRARGGAIYTGIDCINEALTITISLVLRWAGQADL